MFPHERSLVKRFENRPFALLGVCNDYNPEQAKKLMQEGTVTWRSWWDEAPGRKESIFDRMAVDYMPSYYILDPHGVIQFTPEDFNGDPDVLDRAVERLVREAENAPR